MGHKCICVSVELCRRSYIFTQNMHTKAVKNKIWLPQRKKHYNYLWIAKLAKFLSQICPCIIARTKFPIYIVRGESENWKYRRIKYPSSTARWHFLSEKKHVYLFSSFWCLMNFVLQVEKRQDVICLSCYCIRSSVTAQLNVHILIQKFDKWKEKHLLHHSCVQFPWT